ncbi:MAG: sterol desaturase family protein [Pseudomonadota bacterium]
MRNATNLANLIAGVKRPPSFHSELQILYGDADMSLAIDRALAALKQQVRRLVYWGLQPTLIVLALALPLSGASEDSHFLFWFGVLGVLTLLEILIPARPDWQGTLSEKSALFGFVIVAFFAYGFFEGLFDQTVFPWLASVREQLGLDIWPSDWPLLVQVLLIFASYEFVNYWYHRGAHRWGWLWKLSGHGTHHAFKNLTALNTLANHPFEPVFLLLPRMLVGFLLGGEVVSVAVGSLFMVTTLMTHTNLELNSKLIGLFFTTNRYHIHHHSMVRDESNTNYGCACILWDRVFGTFADADTEETGIGHRQPTYTEMYLMPFREPKSSAVAPLRGVTDNA